MLIQSTNIKLYICENPSVTGVSEYECETLILLNSKSLIHIYSTGLYYLLLLQTLGLTEMRYPKCQRPFEVI